MLTRHRGPQSSDTCGGRRSGVMHAKLVFSPTPPLAPVAKVLVSGHTLRREVVNAACRHSVESQPNQKHRLRSCPLLPNRSVTLTAEIC